MEDNTILALVRRDEEESQKNPLLKMYGEAQRREIYRGCDPSPSTCQPSRAQGWIPHRPPRTPTDLSAVHFHPSEKTIEKLIEHDEAEYARNSLNYGTWSDSKKKELYRLTSSELGAKSSPVPEPLIPASLRRQPASQGPFKTLSNYPLDGIKDEGTEDELYIEYDSCKRLNRLKNALEAHKFGQNKEEGEAEVLQALNEAKAIQDAEIRRKDLYATLKKRTQRADTAVTSEISPQPNFFSYSNSTVPGPYLSLDQKGDFTRFEALQHRFPVCRTSESLHKRNKERQNRSAHIFPRVMQKNRASEKGLSTQHDGEGAHLRKWKREMGIDC